MRSNNRLGCLTWPALIATLITFFVITGTIFAEGFALFSPGELSAKTGHVLGNIRSHAQISSNCEQCHSAPWEADIMQDHCIRCHANIKVELTATRRHSPHGPVTTVISRPKSQTNIRIYPISATACSAMQMGEKTDRLNATNQMNRTRLHQKPCFIHLYSLLPYTPPFNPPAEPSCRITRQAAWQNWMKDSARM